MENNIVKCRYSKCEKLHDVKELPKDQAVVSGGNFYYHPDCYKVKTTIEQIRDIFYQNINPMMTGQQIGILVKTINNIVFDKGCDAEYLKFALEYFIAKKPGSLHQPYGLHYIIQDKTVKSEWDKRMKEKLKVDIKSKAESLKVENTPDMDFQKPSFTYKAQKSGGFADILIKEG